MSLTWVPCQNPILRLNLGLPGPKSKEWDFNKNKKHHLVVEDQSKLSEYASLKHIKCAKVEIITENTF